MPAIHLVFSLAERWLLATRHGAIRPKHRQRYLGEFVFRFNRTKAKVIGHGFVRLIQYAIKTPPTTCRGTVHGVAEGLQRGGKTVLTQPRTRSHS